MRDSHTKPSLNQCKTEAFVFLSFFTITKFSELMHNVEKQLILAGKLS